jgi:hypothetical protein
MRCDDDQSALSAMRAHCLSKARARSLIQSGHWLVEQPKRTINNEETR